MVFDDNRGGFGRARSPGRVEVSRQSNVVVRDKVLMHGGTESRQDRFTEWVCWHQSKDNEMMEDGGVLVGLRMRCFFAMSACKQ